MKTICFITGTRADYGIMAPLMKRLEERDDVRLQIIATNMHLSPEFGLTVNEIIADGLPVDWRVDSLLSGDTPSATVKSMGLTEIGMADAFAHLKPDLAVILGDRYEMLAAASAALIFRIPVVHLHGGETTEGAYDDNIRHAITQLASYHLTSTEQYAKKVAQMIGRSDNVYWTGSLGADNILKENFLSPEELKESINFDLGDRYMVATFHPVTTMPGEEVRQTEALLTALEGKLAEGWKVLFTLPNSDTGGRAVAKVIKEWGDKHKDSVKIVASLGRRRFYSAMHGASAMIGNSSSGLIEAPSFGIPTLNIGDRQKGRAQGESVVNVPAETDAIEKGLDKVLSKEFREFSRTCPNPYYKRDAVGEAESLILSFCGNIQK